MSESPASFSGKFILVAKIEAKPGKADELQVALTHIRDHAKTQEPDTLEFRVTRSGDNFLIFEEYASRKALAIHGNTDVFKTWGPKIGELRAKDPEILFYEEV